ncbi:acetate kinase [Haploplasma axanthum]|uniref:Acetate kinase n=2 Tax=Haploplasma axanthum TaxID=29552 RepID=A0A449BF58_HAPAX|nr:acetate kinase [Haploplasma axanthum]
MKIIAINAGSSSLKFQLLEMPEETVITSGVVEKIGSKDAIFTIKFNGKKDEKITEIKNHSVAVEMLLEALISNGIIKSVDEIEGVGHRIVQGGEIFQEAAVINDKVIEQIEGLAPLAPLHNHAHVIGIRAFVEALPNVLQLAVFDTTFHQTMDETSYLYATPYEWYEKYGVRKYGFHGTSHQYVSIEAAKRLNNKHAKLISCHIGNGVSITAIKDGKSIDTSMGLTPLEGVPMGTRTGNIDPAVLGLLQTKEGKSLEELLEIINKKSGYLGVSGISNDARDLFKAHFAGNKRATLALQIQAKRIADYIGSYYIQLQGLDAIIFTAGIGENSFLVRKLITDHLGVLGVEIDQEVNKATMGDEAVISTPNSKVKVLVIPTNEEVMLAREVYSRIDK